MHDVKRPYGGPDPYGPPPTGGPETVLRLLVSTKRVGSIIGKGGTVVKQVWGAMGCVTSVRSHCSLLMCESDGWLAASHHLRCCLSTFASTHEFVLCCTPLQIRDETGSRIRVVEGIPQCDERVIVISAPDEGPEVEHNAAQVPRPPPSRACNALFAVSLDWYSSPGLRR